MSGNNSDQPTVFHYNNDPSAVGFDDDGDGVAD